MNLQDTAAELALHPSSSCPTDLNFTVSSFLVSLLSAPRLPFNLKTWLSLRFHSLPCKQQPNYFFAFFFFWSRLFLSVHSSTDYKHSGHYSACNLSDSVARFCPYPHPMFHWFSILQQLRNDFLSWNILYPFFYPCLEWLSNLQTLHTPLPESISYPSSNSFLSPFVVGQSLSCPTLCDPMDCSPRGFPVLQHLPELAQTHVRCIGDVIHPSRPLSSPSLPAFNLSQHQGIF